LLGALLCIAAPLPAQAQPPPHIAFQLDYVLGPRGARLCPDLAELRGAIQADFGYDPVQADAPFRLTVAVTPGVGGVIQATMELRDPAGTVTWQDHKRAINNDCVTLISGVALSVRISLDSRVPPIAPSPAPGAQKPANAEPAPAQAEPAPTPTPAESKPTPLPRQAPSLKTAPSPGPSRPDSASTEPSERPRFRTGLGASFAFGAAPDPSLALSFQLGIRLPYASLSLEGRGDLPASDMENGQAQYTTSRFAGSLVPCGHFRIFVGCLLGTVGRQFAFNDVKQGGAWYGEGGLRLGVEVPVLGPFALRFSGDLVMKMSPEVSVRVNEANEMDAQVAWSTPLFNAAFGGGVVADF
jgi:hypothetical protein